METTQKSEQIIKELNTTLYSLEKLIEWKHEGYVTTYFDTNTLYSLEKLIEWKQNRECYFPCF
ncbi:hypothetical protein C789_954 [Microcystis aeruginosa FACHB-905 = DIANCHI905]|nr:hypothetical protein C789_954 [Microcystis aeruginosa FACHB-905 = DIANCHI905]